MSFVVVAAIVCCVGVDVECRERSVTSTTNATLHANQTTHGRLITTTLVFCHIYYCHGI